MLASCCPHSEFWMRLQMPILALFVVERRYMRKTTRGEATKPDAPVIDPQTDPERSTDTLEPSCKSPKILDVVIGAPSEQFHRLGIDLADGARRRSDDQRIVWERFPFGDE